MKKRIADLTETRPRADIVKEAGLDDRTLAAIETGRVHLPLDRAPRLADALDIDTRDFVLLALRQFLPEEVVELIETDPTVYLETRELRSSVIALQVQLTAANSGAKEVAEDD